jgi:hypothetical protein
MTIIEMRNEIIKCMTEMGYYEKEIEKITHDVTMYAWIEYCIAENPQPIENLFNDPGFIEGLEASIEQQMTFEQLFEAIEYNK